MQTIYAMHQSGSDNLEKQEKFLSASLENIQDLYLIMVSTLTELRKKEIEYIEIASKKHLATPEERNPNLKFINNSILLALEESNSLSVALEKRKINNWQANDDTILLLLQDVKQSELYQNYMAKKEATFEEERFFIADLFSEVIAPNEKLYSYLEDFKLTWVDDIPVVNTQILKQLKQFSKTEDFRVSPLYKDVEDKDFASILYRKTVLNEEKLAKEFIDKTPNWDMERIAELDTIILKMAICEFLNFPSIPVKVTINEYLELAKEYSTPKSSIFINGILDNLVKDFQANDRIKKVGRGLI
ncbi:transcription antitermination factor NusB [Flavobacterium aquatile]|uniref:Antitermination protein NusB n=1 Tax=Flavobacterium aquatile LMG 4008 = ATCC 11947 TaxID=1453498 RepID=A0A095SRW8_9FLAO|nr:transcription antitermination factor NusB [Flavobacterium aquatile]KGD67352.1 antitermination protein NusB [Flavobacterium aquatile LMG 4008 = ATCC 11947]OXA67047.1 transcription antitermination factor NusB [Flavobacterium aquatile LMG 4008 = ATCC 11947]GEC78865.1 N utilization substance protein B [Flavobacterium aquatile]